MLDVVERLRAWEIGAVGRPTLYDEAANEIERLRASVRLLRGAHADVNFDTPEDVELQRQVLETADLIVDLPPEYRRSALVDVLLHHWPTNSAGCSGCDVMKLGESWPEHLADEYEKAVRA